MAEHNNDDTAYLKSRYRVLNGKVIPSSYREHFSRYWVGYPVFGSSIAVSATTRLRRQLRERLEHENKAQ